MDEKKTPPEEIRISDAKILQQSFPSSDTIDLNSLFTKDVTTSGSFDLRGFRSTSVARLLNALPLPALLVDRNQIIVFLNESCGVITPKFKEYEGRSFSSLFPIPDHAQKALSLLDQVMVKRSSQALELILGEGAHRIWARIRMRALRLGKSRSVLTLVENLTIEKQQIVMIKQHEETLRKAHGELEQRVRERTADLLVANEALVREVALRKRAELKYRAIFETVPVSIREEDYTTVKAVLDDLRAQGITDFREYFDRHPKALAEAIRGIKIVAVNGETLRLHGAHSKDQILGSIERVLVNESLSAEKEAILAYAEGKAVFETEMPAKTLSGKGLDLLLKMSLPAENAHFKHALVGALDISRRKRAEADSARAKMEWERTFDAVPDLISIMDSKQRILRVNRAMAEKIGERPEHIIGKTCASLFHESGHAPENCPHSQMMSDGRQRIAEIVEQKWGGVYLVSVTPLYDPTGKLLGCVHVARDITKRKQLEEELQYQATRDPLTEIYNRRHFLELLKAEFAGMRRYSVPLSLAICDLDEFKAINDRFGHPAGDVVLKVFARTLETHLRGSDFAGRYGGDEFIVAFPHTPLHGAVESMERIRRVMASTPLRTSDGLEFSASCTIGIAEARNNMRMETLINAADKELYRAKELGRNRVCAAGIEY